MIASALTSSVAPSLVPQAGARRAVRVAAGRAGRCDEISRRELASSAALVAGAAIFAELSAAPPAGADVEFATSSSGLQWADVTVGDGNPPTQVKKIRSKTAHTARHGHQVLHPSAARRSPLPTNSRGQGGEG